MQPPPDVIFGNYVAVMNLATCACSNICFFSSANHSDSQSQSGCDTLMSLSHMAKYLEEGPSNIAKCPERAVAESEPEHRTNDRILHSTDYNYNSTKPTKYCRCSTSNNPKHMHETWSDMIIQSNHKNHHHHHESPSSSSSS